jgi:hypothetical protein
MSEQEWEHWQKWEYCELGLSNSKKHGGGLFGGPERWSYDCWANFCGPDGHIKHYQLADIELPLPFNPWRKALALLGAAGWELVSVQLGNLAMSLGHLGHEYKWDTLSWSNKIAYLKRPVMSGRPVDEPLLSL